MVFYIALNSGQVSNFYTNFCNSAQSRYSWELTEPCKKSMVIDIKHISICGGSGGMCHATYRDNKQRNTHDVICCERAETGHYRDVINKYN